MQNGSGPSVDQLALDAIEVILRRSDELIAELTTIATRAAAEDEIRRSVSALAGVRWELLRTRPRHVREIAVFLPSNNVLYSYVLFGLIPLLYATHVTARPSNRVASVAAAVHRIIATDSRLSGRVAVDLVSLSQREFVAACAAADVVVFNGQPRNAERVGEQLPVDTPMLSFGSGPNPVVVGPGADIETMVATLVSVRTYNSGQDCLCPDVVFAHASVADELVDGLRIAAAALSVGGQGEPDAEIVPLSYSDAATEVGNFLAGHRRYVVRGGHLSRNSLFVPPTVLDLPWSASFHPPEFFAPVLCVVRYSYSSDVVRWLQSPEELVRGMYVSVFGEDGLRRLRIGTSVVLWEQTTFDAEDGNAPLGGYGADASAVRIGSTTVARPLLLSAELGATHGRTADVVTRIPVAVSEATR